MTPAQRFLAAIRGQAPDRVPAARDLGWYDRATGRLPRLEQPAPQPYNAPA